MQLINNQSTEEILAIVKENQKNFKDTLQRVESILLNERGFITKIKAGQPLVLLMSGGLDSIVSVSYIIETYKAEIYPLFIKRGARAEKYEIESALYYTDFYKKKYPGKIHDLFVLEADIPSSALKKDFPKERINAIGHPLRNSTLQNYAVMYATYLNGKFNTSISTIFTGSVGDDTTCPELSILSLRSQTLNVCLNLGDWSWQITSPLIDPLLSKDVIFKKDLILWAKEKNIPLNKTRTCVSDTPIADGTCNECRRRLKVFESLNMTDEVPYLKRD